MRDKKLWLSAGLMIVLVFCFGIEIYGQTVTDVIDDPEAYAVYSVVLPIRAREPFSLPEKVVDHFAILQETRSVTACPRADQLPQEWRAVLENYTKENVRVRTILPGFDLGLPYVLVSLAEVRSLLLQAGNDGKTFRQGWPEAYAQFPSGRLLAVSAVGFDESRTRALVVLQYNCGLSQVYQPFGQYDCHGGDSIFLQKQEGRWTLARSVTSCNWIA